MGISNTTSSINAVSGNEDIFGFNRIHGKKLQASNLKISGPATLSQPVLINASITNASIFNAGIRTASIDRLNVRSAVILNATFMNATIINATVVQASIQKAKILSASITNATINKLKVRYGNYINASINKSYTVNARIDNASIANASTDRIRTRSLVANTATITSLVVPVERRTITPKLSDYVSTPSDNTIVIGGIVPSSVHITLPYATLQNLGVVMHVINNSTMAVVASCRSGDTIEGVAKIKMTSRYDKISVVVATPALWVEV